MYAPSAIIDGDTKVSSWKAVVCGASVGCGIPVAMFSLLGGFGFFGSSSDGATKSSRGIIFGLRGHIPVNSNLEIPFSIEATFIYALLKSDVTSYSVILCSCSRFIVLSISFLYAALNGPKNVTSNGLSVCKVCGGNETITIP